MSFQVRLYTLPKRDNSTKRPTGDGTLYNCVMKHGCGILNPSISLDLGLSSDPSQYNYAYIQAFGRYYFIEEWYFEERLWTASLKVDVLATYKSQIGSSNLYVLRAANAFDGRIIDELYPTKTGCTFESVPGNALWSTTGMYVIGVANQYPTIASLCYYVMNIGQLRTFIAALMDVQLLEDNGFVDLPDFGLQLQKSFVDPIQYIRSAIYIPMAISGSLGYALDINGWAVGEGSSQAASLADNTQSITRTFTIPKHPDTSDRGAYLNSAPFTSATLTIPPFGCISLDTSVTANADTVTAKVDVDIITGLGILTITCKGITLSRVEAQVGVPINLSQVTRDYLGAATSVVSGAVAAVGNAASGNIGAAIGSGVSALGDAARAMMPRSQTIGSGGGYSQLWGQPHLDMQFFRAVDDDPVHNGRPLCEIRNIATLGGYMLIQDGDVEINGTSQEDSMIRDYLESGFYYE